jgi:molybdate transport system ATP-binding protein
MIDHWAIFTENNSNKAKLIRQFLKSKIEGKLSIFNDLNGVLFSKYTLKQLMDEEDRHGTKIITKGTPQTLRSMSNGEQKKTLLAHLLLQDTDFIILDNPFDNLDTASQAELLDTLTERSDHTTFIQIISRQNDLLPFISNFAYLNIDELSFYDDVKDIFSLTRASDSTDRIPDPLHPIIYENETLIHLDGITIGFGEKTVLNNIQWKIKKKSFWQLVGKNGSGKTTLLSMLTGDNSKGYGQKLFLFGKKKGSGESIWDIKEKIGYFTPSMTDKFTGRHSIEHMLISGMNDSVGLYIKPTEAQLRLAKSWLLLLDLWEQKDYLFSELSMGQQRLIMTTRAMIKHPLLLILDEPTEGLDDASAELLVSLVNKIAEESTTAIVFVSHRQEPNLNPDSVYELIMTPQGSIGKVI